MPKRILLFLIAVSLLLGALWFSQLRAPPVTVSGYVEADEIRVGSRVGGRVAEVMTEEGARVRKGDVLFRLEPFDLYELEKEADKTLGARQAEFDKLQAGVRAEDIAQAKARYDQMSARLLRLTNGPLMQEIEAARGRKEAAVAEYALAEQNLGRVRKLIRDNAISQQDYEVVEERLKSTRATVAVRTNELEILEMGTRPESVQEAQAMVDEARASWERAQAGFRTEEITAAAAARDAAAANLTAIRRRIEELEVTSPVDGVVEALDLQAGDLVPANAPALSLMDTRHMWVRTFVPENRLNLTIGQQLVVTVDSYPDREFLGALSFISRQGEFTPSNIQTPEERSKQVFRIKVQLKEGLAELRPGMAVDVHLP